MIETKSKPLGGKAYGSIGHLPQSRMGPGDHAMPAGQAKICLEKTRDKHDLVIVQEKLDGSCVSVAKIDGKIYALTRAGWLASTSPFQQHWMFDAWVKENQHRFQHTLSNGERICGEWLAQAHGTKYDLRHEPFVPFDYIRNSENGGKPQRESYQVFLERALTSGFTVPRELHYAFAPYSIEQMLLAIEDRSFHGAVDPIEGAVWRVQRNGVIDFLAKYVRPEKRDGIYLPEVSGGEAVWNWRRAE